MTEPTGNPLNVIVTGGAGFIGRRVVGGLAAKDAAVCAVDRIPKPADCPEGVEYRCADLSESLHGLPDRFVLVHLAWNMDRSDAGAQADSVVGFRRLLDLPGLSGVVALGSAEEYGELEGRLEEEMAPGRELSAYGRAKHEACRMAQAWAQETGIPVIWLRPFIVYGPGQRGSMVIPTAVDCARRRQPADFSAGLQYRDFVHVRDVANGIVRAAETVQKTGDSFAVCNLGCGRSVQLRSVLERIARNLGAEDFFIWARAPCAKGNRASSSPPFLPPGPFWTGKRKFRGRRGLTVCAGRGEPTTDEHGFIRIAA